MKTAVASPPAGLPYPAARLADFLELIKPEVTSLVVVSALAGFYMGSQGSLNWPLLLHALLGVGLVSGGTAAFNHYLERAEDARMRRTARRPLPAGRMNPPSAFWFAAALSGVGIVYLAVRVNSLASLLAFATWASYLFFYTPLKKRTVLCTTVGAFPGAAPPLIGWAAATNSLSAEAWVLYAILFCWQFPHFLSIAWIYREDYQRGGLLMLPVVDPTGIATGRQMTFYAALLLPVSVLPTVLGMAGALYFWSALLLSVLFLVVTLQHALDPSVKHARRLLQATIYYLPILFALLAIDKAR